jgi:Flp pilus assembly protein TadD/2-polyprenyl-3-methyl-5-hydroxy-6-metoxy-1,4-benzoquinol methylase
MNRAEKRRQRKLAEKAARNLKPAGSPDPATGQHAPNIEQALALAIEHHNAGRLAKAERIYRRILQAAPDQPDALHLLGVLAHQSGKYDSATELIGKALSIEPDNADAHYNLGKVLKQQGKPAEAAASYRKALAIEPNLADGHNNLGAALHELDRLDEAVASFQKALAIEPNLADAHYNLGAALHDLGRPEDAVAGFREALMLEPDFAGAHSRLGSALGEMGRLDEAFTCHRRAVALDPQNELFWAGFAEILKKLSFTSADDDLLQYLSDLLERPTIGVGDIIRPIISALRHHGDFAAILERAASGKPEIGTTFAEAAALLSSIPVFLRIMALSPLHDPEIERMLTALRHAMIRDAKAHDLNGTAIPFCAALALQCFANEYIFAETPEETASVLDLQQLIAKLVGEQQDVPPFLIAALGAYRPLFAFPWGRKLCDRDWTGDIGQVVERLIAEPLEERRLRADIPSLTAIQDTVSRSVRDQYEEHPYPRWIKAGLYDNARSIGSVLQDPRLGLDLADYVSPESPEILIAGCGTGQHALETATRFLNARVLAVDLSASSLSYAARKTRELGVSNIEYALADILELGGVKRQFDLIESAGVLHHLADPLAGWRVLVDLLRPGGLMMVALYSEAARRHIVEARTLIAEQGYTGTAEDIRKCRLDIMARAENGDREMAKICTARDFFSLSNCRDLLFHVQEHRFKLPQIEQALDALNLKFLGFEFKNQSTVRAFRKSHPDRRALVSLGEWDAFERTHPATFAGMYQFWCAKI